MQKLLIVLSIFMISFLGLISRVDAASVSSGNNNLTVTGDLGREVRVSNFSSIGKGQFLEMYFYDANKKVTLSYIGGSNTIGASSSTSSFNARYVKFILAPNSTLTEFRLGLDKENNYITSFEVLAPPEVPTLSGVAGDKNVTLNWNVQSGVVDSYDVYVDGAKSLNVKTNSAYIGGLTNGREYSFYVKAKNDMGESAASLAIRLTPKEPPPPPPPPDTTPPTVPVLNGKPGNGQAVLNWTRSPEPDLSGYRLYQNGEKVGDYSTNSATISKLKNGTEYTFQVSSFDTTGNESKLSNKITITPAEKLDVNLIPNGDSIVVQIISGGVGPYVINWGAAQKTVDQSQYTIPNLKFDTEYTVTITDANGLTYSAKVNTGTEKGYVPPTFPSPQDMFQKMLDVFGTAGTIALAIIGGAIALGIMCVLALWGWRLLKRWLNRAK